MDDLTIIYITAGQISNSFAHAVRKQLARSAREIPIISISKTPLKFGRNLVSNYPISHIGIYQDALIGARLAETKYIAIAEDDVLYAPEHFKKRSSPGVFAYNVSCWSIFTWVEPAIFTHKLMGRRNHGMLICERDLYIKAMEERFAKYPDPSKVNLSIWAEPGKYERHLGVKEYPTESFYTNPTNIMFFHEQGLSFSGLGTRKRLGELRAWDIPYWGEAKNIRRLFK